MLVEDALFATLDPTTRRAETADGRCTPSPTRSAWSGACPTIWSKRSGRRWRSRTTADLLVHVVDGADVDPQGQISAVRGVLADIGAGDVAELVVINKVDRAGAETLAVLRTSYPDAVVVSARTGVGMDRCGRRSSPGCRGPRWRCER